MAYLYRHIRLDKNQPFYIGISKDDNSNFRRAYYKSKQKRNKIWIDILNKTTYKVEILFENLSWEEACEKEKEFILLYGRIDLKTGTLANMTNGGDGMVGVIRTEEYKLKISQRQKDGKAYWFGKMLTENHKQKISNSLKNRVHSKDTKNKISNSLKGEKHQFYGKSTPISKKVIDTTTNIIYNSIRLCEKHTGFSKLSEKLSGKRKNNTSITYYDS
jgi:hypothetical protein